MKKESGLSDSEKESFHIEKFIFHIIFAHEHVPTYLEEVSLTSEQEEFFKKRFGEISEGTQFVFKDKENSILYKNCKAIHDDPDANFIAMSKLITSLFRQHHKKTANDGVFITALVSMKNAQKLVFLLKLDHRIVYQYKTTRNRALLEEIKNTFIEDKKAIQKAALVDISDHYKWDVLAKDRSAVSMPKPITDYFYNFLEVIERETPGRLTELAVKFTNSWAVQSNAELDPNQDPASYKSRAINYLMAADKFKTTDFINAVINSDDPDDERRERLRKSFRDFLGEKGLSGQTFVPFKDSLTTARKKNVRLTAEGIKIEWMGDPAESNLTISPQKDKDGFFNITIKTTKIDILDNAK
ncbi:nucleoid-associated protein [Chitinophaga cymbidii]|uniref:Nucleoid-associated protein n=1 Tax=Chitinophaga cymbidii TaxID=1096750 RepID=A0A512RPP2_9BACT|nr:nucleoid-associated protein [Chitinophaga cymbidii]GEP97669.1 hypothetical protein CCY01nite_39290 [Chitinophaga cymbidii]